MRLPDFGNLVLNYFDIVQTAVIFLSYGADSNVKWGECRLAGEEAV